MPLFAYGTLRDPDVCFAVLGHRLEPGQLAAALAPGCRVVTFPGRSYPGLVRAAGAVAEGTLISGLTAADLALLDRFEGDEYRRQTIELIVTGTPATADVYWPSRLIPDSAADWRLDSWVARHKTAFLAAEAGSIAQQRQPPAARADAGR